MHKITLWEVKKMKKYIFLLSLIAALSLSACSSEDGNSSALNADVSESSESAAAVEEEASEEDIEGTESSEDGENTDSAESADNVESTDSEAIPPLYSEEETSDEKSYTVTVDIDNEYTIDDEATIQKIDDWLQKASDDSETKAITDYIERDGGHFEIKTNGGDYRIDLFPEDYDIANETEEDENGNVHYQYNIQANGYHYQVPIDLTFELTDIISDATGVDFSELYDFM
jgi:hypothetical protein